LEILFTGSLEKYARNREERKNWKILRLDRKIGYKGRGVEGLRGLYGSPCRELNFFGKSLIKNLRALRARFVQDLRRDWLNIRSSRVKNNGNIRKMEYRQAKFTPPSSL